MQVSLWQHGIRCFYFFMLMIHNEAIEASKWSSDLIFLCNCYDIWEYYDHVNGFLFNSIHSIPWPVYEHNMQTFNPCNKMIFRNCDFRNQKMFMLTFRKAFVAQTQHVKSQLCVQVFVSASNVLATVQTWCCSLRCYHHNAILHTTRHPLMSYYTDTA